MAQAARLVRRGAAKLVVAARGIAGLGPGTVASVVVDSLAVDLDAWRDRRVIRRAARRARQRPAGGRAPGRLLSVEPLVDRSAGTPGAPGDGPGRRRAVGARCHFERMDLELRFLADDLVRVSWEPGLPPPPWGVGPAGRGVGDLPTVQVDVDAARGCTLRSETLCVEVSPDGGLRYHGRHVGHDGPLLRRELPPLRLGAAGTVRHLLRPGERVVGLGEQAGPVDLRGTAHRLWNRDPGGAWGPGADPLYCGVPALVGLHPGGDVLAFYENPHEAAVQIDRPGRAGPELVTLTFVAGMLRHYVAVGPLPRLTERYAQLTGRPPLPPRWALGYHHSKWGYRSQADIEEVAVGFGAEGLPLSAVYLDIDHMDGYRVFTVDRRRFPDLPGLGRRLARRGTRVVAIVDPAVKADPELDVFRQGREEGRFLASGRGGRPYLGVVWPGRAAFPDFTDPAVRRWWAGWYTRLLDAGVAGVWHDMNEPTSFALWGDRTLPRRIRHAEEGRGGDHRGCHNAYGLLMDRAGWEALAAQRPDRRPFVLSRAGWAGVQRWAWNWTGDAESTWEGLRQQVATAIGLGLSGVPFTGSDVGGFSGAPEPELYTRWLELSVFMPLCRTHCAASSPPREPWRFPRPYRAVVGDLVRLRYRLMPYLYSLAHEAATTGHPLVRPLCWPVPASCAGAQPLDPRRWWSDDAFLLGDSMLVAPVSRGGATSRTVLLPPGLWYHWSLACATAPPGADGSDAGGSDDAGSGDRSGRAVPLDGGREVELEAPVGRPVVLVRGGAVVPLDDGWADATEGDGALSAGHEPRRLAFHCFPDAQGARGTCYDDAGDGYGAWRLDHVQLGRRAATARTPEAGSGGRPGPDAGGWEVTWRREGSYPSPERVRVVLHGIAAVAAAADGSPVSVTTAGEAGGVHRTTVECPPFGSLRVGA